MYFKLGSTHNYILNFDFVKIKIILFIYFIVILIKHIFFKIYFFKITSIYIYIYMVDSVVMIAFQLIFYTDMHFIDVFLFFKNYF